MVLLGDRARRHRQRALAAGALHGRVPDRPVEIGEPHGAGLRAGERVGAQPHEGHRRGRVDLQERLDHLAGPRRELRPLADLLRAAPGDDVGLQARGPELQRRAVGTGRALGQVEHEAVAALLVDLRPARERALGLLVHHQVGRVALVEQVEPPLGRERFAALQPGRVALEQPRVSAQVAAERRAHARLTALCVGDERGDVCVGEEEPELADGHRRAPSHGTAAPRAHKEGATR